MEREKVPLPHPLKLTQAVRLDYPAAREVRVSFPDRWELIHQLFRDDTPLYIAGFPPSEEQPRKDRFYGLPPEVNQKLTTYRQYKVFLPWPEPIISVSWDEVADEGRVEGMRALNIRLRSLDQAQAWYGKTVGVIWEAFLPKPGRGENWEEELATFWEQVEQDIGVAKVYTMPYEPTFEEGYTEFLEQLGYSPDSDHPRWWSKLAK